MAEVTKQSGELTFEIAFSDNEIGPSANLTWGALTLATSDLIVWKRLEWSWVELLEWLAQSWTQLQVEDGLPFSVSPSSITSVRRLSAEVATDASPQTQEDFWNFLEGHDLSRGLEGALAPSVVIWRQGLDAYVLTDEDVSSLSWVAVERALFDLGEAIAARLRGLQLDPRGKAALSEWASREKRSGKDVLELVTGFESDALARAARALDSNVRELTRPETSELLAVARMSSALTQADVKEALDVVLDVPKVEVTALNAVSEAIVSVVAEFSNKPAFSQGHEAALALRTYLGVPDGDRFDSQGWLKRYGVEVRDIALRAHFVDALACWGEWRGPAVFVNVNGRHSKSPAGRNASLAHEICHLLLDREGALPAAEVLGGRVNLFVEARARAFAAELLLPRREAGRALASVVDADSAALVLRTIMSRFRVSAEMVAWQARNSDQWLAPDVRAFLRSKVAEPGRF